MRRPVHPRPHEVVLGARGVRRHEHVDAAPLEHRGRRQIHEREVVAPQPGDALRGRIAGEELVALHVAARPRQDRDGVLGHVEERRRPPEAARHHHPVRHPVLHRPEPVARLGCQHGRAQPGVGQVALGQEAHLRRRRRTGHGRRSRRHGAPSLHPPRNERGRPMGRPHRTHTVTARARRAAIGSRVMPAAGGACPDRRRAPPAARRPAAAPCPPRRRPAAGRPYRCSASSSAGSPGAATGAAAWAATATSG